ncbi:hypothetical protein SPAN111604_07900 [Sphingomonas antarctica]
MFARRIELQDDQPNKRSWWLDDLDRAAHIAQRLDRQVDGWLSGFELPQPVIRILIALHQSPGTPQRVIGEQIDMSPPQISRNVKDLIEHGLIDVDQSFSERLRVLRLTYAGQLRARELVNARKAAFAASIDAIAV